MTTALRAVGSGEDIVGEGPVWSPAQQALYWVDIRAPAVRRWACATGQTQSWTMPELVSCVAVRETGGLIVALSGSLQIFDPETEVFSQLAAPHRDQPNMRFNDGKCDRQGRFWVGSMATDEASRGPDGVLYRVTQCACDSMLDDFYLPNSLCWSPNGDTMYFADSTRRTIWAFPFDTSTGTPGPRRVFARIEGPAVPDGATVDNEGYVWCALFDGWSIVRFAPDGSVDRELHLPVQRPTSCAFGGPRLDRLYITSARRGLTAELLARQPLAGRLLEAVPEATGIPDACFAG